VPEALGPAEVGDEADGANQQEREGEQVGDAGEVAVLGPAEPLDEDGDEVRPGGDAAEEEVGYDPAAPVGVGDEEFMPLPHRAPGLRFTA
jgi:hypothetical protein